ncbi:MAG: non-hydrolyzing UDP-N-acetylglucosamine 2-epimerase, partial [Chloroflexota bacterium]
MPRVTVIFGTRPEYIKLALIIRRLKICWPDTEVIVTGQHYDHNMSSMFLEELSIPPPEVVLNCHERSASTQTASILTAVATRLEVSHPDIVLTLGDTNTTLAASLAAAQARIPICHVEAGCRCYDMTMPEEVNRRVVDALASLWCVPTEACRTNLLCEGADERRIHVVGYTQGEVWRSVEASIDPYPPLNQLGLERGRYVIMTIHRQENTDDIGRLNAIIDSIEGIDMPVIWFSHPRTQKRIEEFGLKPRLLQMPHLQIEQPAKYLKFMALLSNSAVVITDSGGVQTEAAILGIPCVVARERTEQTECVEAGIAILAGINTKVIIDSVHAASSTKTRDFKSIQVYPPLPSSELVLHALEGFWRALP